APTYKEYSEKYLTDHFKKWAARGEFETTEKYMERVNPTSIEAERKRLERESAETYLTTYGGNLRLNNLSLMPYDPQNEVFRINSNYGPIIIQVPLKNNEAESFKAVFEAIDMRAPQYYIDEDGVKIASVTVVTPGGQSYKYDNDKALAYHEPPRVNFDYAAIFSDSRPQGANPAQGGSDVIRVRRKSDVDERIPQNSKVAGNRVALIIANENYANAANVPSAYNDGEAVKEYCHKVLGMPENNIIYLSDATLAPIYGALRNLKNRVDALDGRAEVFVYYAGHGFPDEQTKSAFILPVDGYATAPETCLELSKVYDDLGKMNAASVMVFLDACFSGAERGSSDAMLVKDGRTVVIKPKASAPKGNMMILTATSDKETALPYAEKNHGLFTYYLLKHLQETKGNTTPKELSDYVIANVKRQSNFINSKPQTPTVSLSGNMSQLWSTMKLRP
ncbi:MAG: caspase family protein, partial [Muribaculaceae bacterium]|nr:caspase family protein [Muribaculaceae bacterium]